MKQSLTILMFLFTGISSLSAQVEWARQSKENTNLGAGTTLSHDIAWGLAGNLYIAGDLKGNAEFEQVAFPQDNFNSMYLANYKRDGSLDWARRILGNGNNSCKAIATDAANNVFIAGEYRQTNALTILDFGDFTMPGVTSPSAFIAMADSNGTFLWANSILSTPPSDVVVTDMQVDPAGNIYVMGLMSDSVEIDGVFYNTGRPDAATTFLAKYLPSGNLAWFKHSTHTEGMINPIMLPGHMTIGSQGQIFLNGTFSTFGDFGGSIVWGEDTLTHIIEGGQYLTRLDTTGKMIWWHAMQTGDGQYPHEMGLDEQDNVYFTLQRGTKLEFTDGNLNTNDFKGHVLLLKYNQDGQRQFITDVAYGEVSSSGSIRNRSVTIHTRPNGTTFLTGLYGANSGSFIVFGNTDTLAMPNNSNDGARQFLTAFDKNGNYIDVGFVVDEYLTEPDFYWENTAMISDDQGQFYMTGGFAGNLVLDNDSLLTPDTGAAGGQTFTVKFDAQGILDLSTTSIRDQALLNQQLTLYPNPASEWISLELETDVYPLRGTISLYSMQGVLVRESRLEGSNQGIQVGDLPAGLYLCQLDLDGQVYSQKVWIR